MSAVFWKELADHFASRRFIILFALIAFSGLFASFVAANSLRSSVEQAPTEFLFLLLFTTGGGALPSFLTFLGFFAPLVGLVLGFDAINSEHARGTMSRLLSQPIYRDSVINGKFLAGLTTVAVMLLCLFLIIVGLGINMLGFAPSIQEIGRLGIFLLVSIVYVSFWLALSMLFSVLFRRTVVSAMGAFALWIFLSFFVSMVASSVADFVVPEQVTVEQVLRFSGVERMVLRLSPVNVFGEAAEVLLTPLVRSLGPVLIVDIIGLLPTPLSLLQSLMLVAPHLITLFALTAVCFAISYTRFMREEIRP